MVGVPYLVLMGLLWLIYRACRGADQRVMAAVELSVPPQTQAPLTA